MVELIGVLHVLNLFFINRAHVSSTMTNLKNGFLIIIFIPEQLYPDDV